MVRDEARLEDGLVRTQASNRTSSRLTTNRISATAFFIMSSLAIFVRLVVFMLVLYVVLVVNVQSWSD